MTAPTVRLAEDVPQRGVRRARATLLHPDRPLPVVDEHLRVRLPSPHPMPLLADALVAEAAGHLTPVDPALYAAELADCHPGALVVAVYRGPRCWLRFGSRHRLLVGEEGWPVQSWAAWASVAHVWLVAGLDPAAFDPAAVRVVRTVRGHAPALSAPFPDGSVHGGAPTRPVPAPDSLVPCYAPAPPGSAAKGPVPGGVGGGCSVSAGSSASSRAAASTASAAPDRPADAYRDSASR
ncbi:hypothetical protein QFZ71_004332 [Streptomyces sp. V2I9]|nr:hypothetical protein [Streptomyces sp. V2I9]